MHSYNNILSTLVIYALFVRSTMLQEMQEVYANVYGKYMQPNYCGQLDLKFDRTFLLIPNNMLINSPNPFIVVILHSNTSKYFQHNHDKNEAQ